MNLFDDTTIIDSGVLKCALCDCDYIEFIYPDGKMVCKDHLPEEDPRENIEPWQSRFGKPFKLRDSAPDDSCL